MQRTFFDQVLDVYEGMTTDVGGELHSVAHKRGLKVWYDDAHREHYEAQLIRIDGDAFIEIGFHSEYPKPAENDAVLAKLAAAEATWRSALGDEPEVGPFLGNTTWRRISEVWDPPDPDDVDDAIEVGARLAEYVVAIEPLRRRPERV